MKHIIILLSMLMPTHLYAAGKIQGADVKTEAELIAAGATKAQMIKDSQIYVTSNGINDKMSTAITSGLLGGLPSWLTARVYSVGQSVTESNKIYKCLIAHTSGTFSTDLAAARWVEISPVDLTSSTGILSIANGGTASSTRVFVDLSSNETIGGIKTFSSDIVGSITGNAATATNVTNNANLTGHVTSTGNAALLGSFSSSNLLTALTDETGSGASVFSTSPTLVTPVLGAANGSSLALGGSLTAGTLISASSTTAGVIFPRMTSAQKNAITPVAGMELYDTDLNIKQYYNGSQWIANSSVQLDNVYTMTSTGRPGGSPVPGNLNKSGWITAIGAASSGISTVTFGTGVFSAAPNCTCTGIGSNPEDTSCQVRAVPTTSGMTVYTSVNGANSTMDFILSCQKTGADYQSADAYIANNSNTDWAACTFSTLAWQGLGTVTNNLQCRRNNGQLEMYGKFTTGTVTGSSVQIPLPTNFGSLTTSSAITANSVRGVIFRSAATDSNVIFSGILQPSIAYINMTASIGISGQAPNAPTTGSSLGSTTQYDISLIQIPVTGWVNSNLIVASLQGTPNIPGSTVKVDEMSFDFGTTNATTDCTASPCSYLDQLGSGSITSVTRSGAGTYTINLSRTYSKLKCDVRWVNNGADAAQLQGFVGATATSPLSCASCSTLPIRAINYNLSGVVDVHAGLRCTGEY